MPRRRNSEFEDDTIHQRMEMTRMLYRLCSDLDQKDGPPYDGYYIDDVKGLREWYEAEKERLV